MKKPVNPKRLYDQVSWRKASRMFLNDPSNALCAWCLLQGRDRPATLTDHVLPHNGDLTLFWDRSNWQGLCATCHGEKRRQENGKPVTGASVDGIPIDPQHHWND